MKRTATAELAAWVSRRGRKPLVIRGARQVGKSYLIRDFARSHGLELVELNFERDPKAATLFAEGAAAQVLRGIEAFTGKRVALGRSLLFLDEIQAAPHVLAKLRWLHEEAPRLAVVAAGSLLDFVLADHTFLHLEPMSFTEFLLGLGEDDLAALIAEIDPRRGLAEALHARLLERFRDYVLVGGMPEAVDTYRQERSLIEVARVHQDLLATFRDDFAKYASAVHRDRLIKVLDAAPRMIGGKFVYSRVDRDERAAALRQAVELLCRARVCHRVDATQATGPPLGAELDDRRYKLILLDTGLVSASLGLAVTDLARAEDLVMANEGAIAEQAVGQALRVAQPPFHEPRLYYWARDTPGSEAEVDYLVQRGTRIVPIEVKAGSTGALRSLHTLMAVRKWKRAVRFNADPPSVTQVSTLTSTGARAAYELISLPLYLASQLEQVLRH